MKGPQYVSGLTFHSKQAQTWDQTRLFRDLPSLVLKITKGKGYVTSLGNMLHCWPIFMGKRLLLINNLKLTVLALILPPGSTVDSLWPQWPPCMD